MRKRVLIVSLMFLILCISFVVAEEPELSVSEKGYACLNEKVIDNCGDLSLEEKIFSLLAINRCKTEIIADKDTNSCWPAGECNAKTTAQAILALDSVNTNTDGSETWLLTQQIDPPNVDWLLQIDPTSADSCSITYKGDSHEISIGEDKKISGREGNCLDVYNDYWLKIEPSCYAEEFEISCGQTFSTSLLYKKDGSEIFYISNDRSTSTGGTTTEKVNSFCFKQGETTRCNYEATLWATRALSQNSKDISAYLPYLITNAEDYSEFIPESFLYSLTNNFKVELLLKQKENAYWFESGDKFYDTAVALYSLQSEKTLQEKIDAQTWLGGVQGDDGCWQNNIINTAFILFSAWPDKASYDDSSLDCNDENNYCMSEAACTQTGGNVLTDYSGCASDICCDTAIPLEDCADLGGDKCSSGEICAGGNFMDSADSNDCCVGGDCEEAQQGNVDSECELNGGTCRSDCFSDETSTTDTCPDYDLCCVDESSQGNYVWILILGIFIILILIGIVFRAKLRKFWLKIKSKSGKGKSSVGRSRRPPRGFPPGPSSSIRPRQSPRRILPPNNRPMRRSMPRHKPRGELDNVLKKLKEMGK
jgi:hypothetical protein